VDQSEPRSFWLKWGDSNLQVGRGTEVGIDVIMEYGHNSKLDVQWLAISTGWGSTGEWAIQN